MRQIEFRGKRIDNGEWEYGFIVGHVNPHKIETEYTSFFIHTGVSVSDFIKVDPSTVGQFTGLTDKNGKKIFEGDVLSGIIKEQQDNDGKNAYQITDKVSFRFGGFNVFGKEFQSAYTARVNNATSLHQFMWYDRGHFNVPDLYFQIDNIEIIGNIHDNPELLNQQQHGS